jgi:hypothetical protein
MRPLITPRASLSGAAIFTLLALGAQPARAQAVLKVSDDVSIKFGMLMQSQGEWSEDPLTDGYSQNLFLRRARFLVGGSLAKNLTFFFETDSPNAGKVVGGTKQGFGMIVQDAFVSWKLRDALILDGGMILTGVARNSLQSATSLMTVDYGPHSFLFSVPTQNAAGRDTGFQLRGNPLAKRLEYRLGLWAGQRDASARNALRGTVRLQYSFLTPETGFFYTGSYFGKKKVLAVGGGYDFQKDYSTLAADAFFDHPLGNGGLTALVDFIRYDGGKTFTALRKQDVIYAEAGYHINAVKLMPFASYSSRNVDAADTGDESRYVVGVGYMAQGNNLNLKASYGKIDRKGGESSNVFSVQLQGFFF